MCGIVEFANPHGIDPAELRGRRDLLIARGPVFYGTTDTEAPLHAYETWGKGPFERLDGIAPLYSSHGVPVIHHHGGMQQ